jgi:hypothetical protein
MKRLTAPCHCRCSFCRLINHAACIYGMCELSPANADIVETNDET